MYGVMDDDVCREVDTRFVGFGFGNRGRENSEGDMVVQSCDCDALNNSV